MSATLARVKRKNKAYAAAISKMLWTGIRRVTEGAGSAVIEELVIATWHDSSNAAFNWFFELDNGDVSYKYHKFKSPVGKPKDKRSKFEKTALIENVALIKMAREKKGLHSHLYKQRFSSEMPRFNDFKVVNTVEDVSKFYATNAKISKAANDGKVRKAFDTAVVTIGNVAFKGIL